MKPSMNVVKQSEAEFFLSHLNKEQRVLAFGFIEEDALAIAGKVKELIIITHQPLPDGAEVASNATIITVLPNKDPGSEDGTKKQFKDYINAAIKEAETGGLFDVIFIRGRARVACAEVCKKLGHADTSVFIYDYNHPNKEFLRKEYFDAEKFLKCQEGEFTMWKFAIKGLKKKVVTAKPRRGKNTARG